LSPAILLGSVDTHRKQSVYTELLADELNQLRTEDFDRQVMPQLEVAQLRAQQLDLLHQILVLLLEAFELADREFVP